MKRVEIREQDDGTWDVLEHTGRCVPACVPQLDDHHPECGWVFVETVLSRGGAEQALASHYATVGAAVTFVEYVFDLAKAMLETP